MSEIKVLLIPTEGKPSLSKIGDQLEDSQKVVGGYIEAVRIPGMIGRIRLMVNENGRMDNLPRNNYATKLVLQTILGNAFVTSHNDEGDAVSISDEDIRSLSKILKMEFEE